MKYSVIIDLLMSTTGIAIFFCYLQFRNFNDLVNYFTAIYVTISLLIAHLVIVYSILKNKDNLYC